MRRTGLPLSSKLLANAGSFLGRILPLALAFGCTAQAASYSFSYLDPVPPSDPTQGASTKTVYVDLPDDPIDVYQAILCETNTPGIAVNARNFLTAARVAAFSNGNLATWYPRSPAGVEAMLDAAAAATGRSDLRDLPLFFTGSSTGGTLSTQAGGQSWQKTAAIVCASYPQSAAYRTNPPESAPPFLFTHGANEVDPAYLPAVLGDRSTYNGKTAYHLSWDSGHDLFGPENAQEFPYLFMMENLRVRQQLGHPTLRGSNGRLSMPPVPVNLGWLGRGSTFGKDVSGNYNIARVSWPPIGPEPTYTGTAKTAAFWFPTEATARAYQAMQGSYSFQANTGANHFSMKMGLPTYYSVHVGDTLTVAPWFNPNHAASLGTISTVECWVGARLHVTRNAPDAYGLWTFNYRPANCEVQPVILVATTSNGTKIGTFRLINVLPARGRGGLSRDYWTGIPGDTVASLTSHASYIADTPTARDELSNPETIGWSGSANPISPTNYADNYGERIRGYIDVKAGTLNLYLAASNSAELWFNPEGEDPAGKILVAKEDTGRTSRSWPDSGTTRSVQFNISSPRRCYIEILHKGGVGSDNCALAWDGTAAGIGINSNGKSIPRLETLWPFRVFNASVALSVNGTTGQVSIPRTFDEDFRLTLTSSDSSAVSVPATVVIPAGQTSATFSVTSGTVASPVTLRAYAYGWPEARFVVSPSPTPILQISGRGTVIASGDTTPATSDDTDFGRALLSGGTVTRTYTLANIGNATLSLAGVTFTGAAAGDFTLLDTLPASLAPGATTTVRVVFDPTAVGARNATLNLASGDPVTPTATFAVTGVGVNNVGGPEINVTGNGSSILTGDTTPTTVDGTDFGTANVSNGAIFKTFVIQNTGPSTLSISGVTITGANASDFTVSHPPLSALPTGSVYFTVRFAPTAAGVRNATVIIANNDADESSYTFAVRGTGSSGPEIEVRGNNVVISNNKTTTGTGDDTEFGTRSSNFTPAEKTYTINNTGAGALDLGTVTITPLTGPGSFVVSQQPASSVAAGSSTTFKVRFLPLGGGATLQSTATVTIPNNDADESPAKFRVSGTGQTPEIECSATSEFVHALATDVAPSAAGTNFGSVSVTGTTSKTIGYTLWNSTSVAVLMVRGITVTGPNASEFTVTPADTLPVQVSALFPITFNVKFKPTGNGTRNATIVIDNNDPNESPFTFDVKGVGTGGPASGSLAFAQSALTAYEEDPKVTVTVRRLGTSVGAVSVFYKLVEGTAVAGYDFGYVSGQLTWADGDTSDRTIDIPMVDDDLAEGAETFTFNLYDVVGATLPSPASATITLRELETNTAPSVVIDTPVSPAYALVGRPLRIDATTTDDGYRAPLAFTWSLVSAPNGGAVAFENPNVEDCNVSFNIPGVYVLRLTANDSQLSGSADITVNVSDAPRLALHLRLDEAFGFTAADASGNAQNGTLNGLPYWQPANGKIAGALVLNRANGSNDYIRVPDNDLLDGTSALTLAAWIRPDYQFSEDRGLIVKHTYSGGTYDLSYRMFFSSTLKVEIGRSDNTVAGTIISNTAVPAQTWTHVAYVFDGSQTSGSRSRLYINGVLDKIGSVAIAAIPNQPSPLYLGTWDPNSGSNGSRLYMGQMDDVRIYRAALSASEVAALANFSPTLSLSRLGTALTNGGADTLSSPITLGAPATVTYQIANSGFGALNLPGPVAISNAVNCSASVASVPPATLASGATAKLGFTITPAAAGNWSFSVSVPSNDSATPSFAWTLSGTARTAYAAWTDGITWGSLDSTALADPDGDGVPNLLEYALNRNPITPTAGSPTTISVTPTPALAIAFTRIADPTLTYIVEATDDLASPASWTTIWSSTGIANVAGPVTVTDTVSLAGKTRRFLRLRVSAP